MLSRKARADKRLVKNIIFSGKSYYGRYTTMRLLRIESGTNRFSVVVSKKTASFATARNTLKRRGYTIIRSVLPSLRTPVHAVIFIKKEGVAVTYKELQDDIIAVFKKAALL